MPGDDPARAYYLLGKLASPARRSPTNCRVARPAALHWPRTLAPRPRHLLLDEPTNHLDLPAIEWLEGELTALRSALVLISHDRRFLENLSRATVWLDRGRTRRLEKSFAHFEPWRDEVLAQEEIERHKLDRKIAHGRRLDALWRHRPAQAQPGAPRQAAGPAHRPARSRSQVAGSVRMTVSEADEGGTRVIDAKRISKSWSDAMVVRDLSLRVHRGERVGRRRPQRAGQDDPAEHADGTAGARQRQCEDRRCREDARLDQTRTVLEPNDTLANVLTGGRGDYIEVGGEQRHVVSYMKDFLFARRPGAHTPVKVAVGRRAGAAAARQGAGAALEPFGAGRADQRPRPRNPRPSRRMIDDYPGTALIVSHDRDFLDRVASSILMAEGDGVFVQYAGGYSDMVAQRGAGVEAAKAAPRADKAEAAKERPPRARKMNFSDRHALEKLPARLAELERQIADLQAQLAAPTFMCATRRNSRRCRKNWRRRSMDTRRARNAGWNSKCCVKNWSAVEHRPYAFIRRPILRPRKTPEIQCPPDRRKRRARMPLGMDIKVVAAPALVQRGSVNVIDLEVVRERTGTRWGRLRNAIYTRLEALLGHSLGPTDFYVRLDETAYVVVMPSCDSADAQLCCLKVAHDLHRNLLGNCAIGDLRLSRVLGERDGALELHQLDLAELYALASRGGVEELCRDIPVPPGGDREAAKPPVAARIDKPVFRFAPVWDAQHEAVMAYRLETEGDTRRMGGPLERHEFKAALKTFLAGMVYANRILSSALAASNRYVVMIPVPFDLLSAPAGRMAIGSACRGLAAGLRPFLVFEIVGAPQGVPQSRMSDLVGALRPFGRAVTVTFPLGDIEQLIHHSAGQQGIGLALPATAASQAARDEIGKLGAAAKRLGMTSTLEGVATPDIADVARQSGIRYLSGPFLGPKVDVPQTMSRLRWRSLAQRGAAAG
ncbi:MAG: hypothetical protein WDN03_17195 [Rhizomicrobium sp.]